MQGAGVSIAFAARHQDIMDRTRLLLEQSWQQSDGVAETAAATRDRLTASEALLLQTSSMVARAAWARAEDGGAPREHCDADGEACDVVRSFKAVEDLIAQVELAAIFNADVLDRLIRQIKALIQSDADQYVLMGILLEGIVQSIDRSVPVAERKDAVAALLSMLIGRIGAL